MNKRRRGKVPYHFHGITIFVPKHKNEIVVKDMGPVTKEKLKSTVDFELIRVIDKIVLYYKKDLDKPIKEPVKTFNPPIEIRVGYKSTDVEQAEGDINKLKLAFWDGSQWVILSDRSHDYHILPPSTAQVAEAKIWSWAGDPPLAWGK